MIDIHSHILHGLDDGAQSLDDSLQMARAAAGDGIHTVVATPHDAEWGTDCSWPQIVARVSMLQGKLDELGIKLNVVPGLEVYLVPNLSQQIEKGSAFSINGSRYMLVELPLHMYPIYAEQAIFELQLRGFVPVLAHPERNAGIEKNPELLRVLVERGVLAQVTAASLCGGFGSRTREAALLLLEHNLVHLIASDAHSPIGHRSPVLSAAVGEAAKLVGEERAKAMVTDIPQAILANHKVEVEPSLALRRRSWSFWRR